MILLRDHVRVVADVFELEAPSTRRLTSGSCAPEVVKISAHTPSLARKEAIGGSPRRNTVSSVGPW